MAMAGALAEIAPTEGKLIDKLQACGAALIVHQFNSLGDIRLINVASCNNHLLCGVCAIRRSLRLLVPNLLKYQTIRAHRPELVPLFVTVTVRNGTDLAERFCHLADSLRLLKKRRLNARRRSGRNVEVAKAPGWLGSYEVKRGTGSGLWHPHCHLLALAEPGGLEVEALSRQWLAVTGDSFQVDSRPLDPGKPLIKAFCELFKYALKVNDLPPVDAWAAREVLRGRKLMFSAGLFRGNACPEANMALRDNTIEFRSRRSGVPYSDIFYQFEEGVGYSVCREKSRFIS